MPVEWGEGKPPPERYRTQKQAGWRRWTKGGGLIVLSMNGMMLDTTSPTCKMMLTMLAAVAEFERDIMKERQREGIAKAKAEGRYKGRKPTARSQAEQVQALAAEGVSATEIAKRLGMGRTSVYRCLADTVAP